MKQNHHHTNFIFPRYVILCIAGFILTSCASLRSYETPVGDISEDLTFRTDELPEDSLSMADFSWRDMFQDEQLQGYIEQALDSNMDVRIAMKNIDIAESYLAQAKVNTLPTLSVGPDVTYQTSSLNTQFGQIIGERQHLVQYTLGIQSSWEADIWGKLKSQQKSAVATHLSSIAGHHAVTSQLVANLASAYYQLLALDEQQELLEDYVAYRSDYIETSKALKEAGMVTEVAVKQAEAQLLNVQSQLVSVEYNMQVQENYIRYLMGESPGSIERTDLESTVISADMKAGYPIQLLENRPDVRMAEFDFMAAFEESNAARMQFYPSFTISASTGLQSIDFEDILSPESFLASVVGGLTQPIFNKRQIRTNYEVRLSQEEIAFLNWRDAILQGVQEVSNALANYENQSEIADLKLQEFETYEIATNYSQDLVNNGMGNYLEVILANENALNARLQYIQARLGQLNSQVTLYRALGGGWQ